MENTLFYGDNLDILRGGYIAAESVDLVYLDPPFNSNRNYNVLFKSSVSGNDAQAQIHAFTDTWEWSALEYNAVIHSQRVPPAVKDALEAMVKLAGKNALTGYLVMMAARLVELHRVLKPSGSLYLHCDPTASHYLKLILDAVFGPQNFLSEIIWKRTSAHSSAKRPGPVHDVILLYAKSGIYTWNQQFQPYGISYIESSYRNVDAKGRRYYLADLTGAGIRHGETGLVWKGIDPTSKGRHWAVPPSELDALYAAGRIQWPSKDGGVPRLIRYLDEMRGVPLQDTWTDISPIGAQATERLGYPTQKPLALLERIIKASSNEGDVVLDPFCGCGTAVVAAEGLGRHWLGIDITSLAIGVIEKRIRKTWPDAQFRVVGLPDSEEDARRLANDDKYEFQDWVVLKLGGQPIHESAPGKAKKGADKGIDGVIYFEDKGRPQKVIISVKGGDNIGVSMVRDLRGTIEREGAAIGVLVIVGKPTKPMLDEAGEAAPYESGYILRGHEQEYPRLQILNIADIIAGKQVEMPPHHEGQTMQTAQRGQRNAGEQGSLFEG